MTDLYRCARCGSYWVYGVVNPRVIPEAEAETLMPDVHARESELGVAFPNSSL
jgi:hypothetical protein